MIALVKLYFLILYFFNLLDTSNFDKAIKLKCADL